MDGWAWTLYKIHISSYGIPSLALKLGIHGISTVARRSRFTIRLENLESDTAVVGQQGEMN